MGAKIKKILSIMIASIMLPSFFKVAESVMTDRLRKMNMLRPKLLLIFGLFLFVFSYSIFNTYISPPYWLEKAYPLPFYQAFFPLITAIVLLIKPEDVLLRIVVYPYPIEASITLLIGVGLTLIGLFQIERTKSNNFRHNIFWTFAWLGIISFLYALLSLLFTLFILAFSYTKEGVVGGLITWSIPILLYPTIIITWLFILFIVLKKI